MAEALTIQNGVTLLTWRERVVTATFNTLLRVRAGDLEEWGEELCNDFPFLWYPKAQEGRSAENPFQVAFKIQGEDAKAVALENRIDFQRRVNARYNACGTVAARVERDNARCHRGNTMVLALADDGLFTTPDTNASVPGIARGFFRQSPNSSLSARRYELAMGLCTPTYDAEEVLRHLREVGDMFRVYIRTDLMTMTDTDPNAQLQPAFDWRGNHSRSSTLPA